MRIGEIMDSVGVLNRVVDAPVCVIHDGEEVVWAPAEVKHLPRKHAEWMVNHSLFLMNPEKGTKCYRLVIQNTGKDESPLTQVQAFRPELLDRANMAPTHFDKETNQPLRTVYLDPNTVPNLAQQETVVKKLNDDAPHAAKVAVADERRAELAGKIEDAVATLSDEQIEAAAAAAVHP